MTTAELVAVITAVTALLTAAAALVRALRAQNAIAAHVQAEHAAATSSARPSEPA